MMTDDTTERCQAAVPRLLGGENLELVLSSLAVTVTTLSGCRSSDPTTKAV
jgi:hypothetical protein